MKKFTFSFKSLLVACGLLIGSANAWGEDYTVTSTTDGLTTTTINFYTYAFNTFGQGSSATPQFATNSISTSNEKTLYLVQDYSNFTFYNYLALPSGDGNVLFRRGSKSSASSTYDGLFAAGRKRYYMSLVNLHAGDVITFTVSNTNNLQFTSNNATYLVESTPTAVIGGTTFVTSGTEYTISSGTQLDMYYGADANQNDYIGIITIKSQYDAVANPSLEQIVAGSTSTIRITAGKCNNSGSTVTTYYTTDGSTPTTDNYTGSFTTSTKDVDITSSTTIKAISVTNGTYGGSSYVVSGDFVAEDPQLNAPSVNITNFNLADGFYYPVYTFTSDQSGIVGYTDQTLTYTYSFNSGAPVTASSYTATTTSGTLRVTVSATGFQDNYTDVAIAGTQYVSTYFFDGSKIYDHATNTVAGNREVDGKNCYHYAMTGMNINGLTVSGLSHAWEITANKSKGFSGRTGSGSVTYTGEFPAGSYVLSYVPGQAGGSGGWEVSSTATVVVKQYSGITSFRVLAPAGTSAYALSAGTDLTQNGTFASDVSGWNTVGTITKESDSSTSGTGFGWNASGWAEMWAENNSASENYAHYNADCYIAQRYANVPAGNYLISADLVANGGNVSVYTISVNGVAQQTANGPYESFTNRSYVINVPTDNSTITIKYAPENGGRAWVGIDNVSCIYDATVSATIGSTGYTTFASPYALDLSSMTASTGEVTAFVASSQDGTTVNLTEAPDDVKASEGLVLKGTAGATITIPVIASSDNTPSNLLVGCPTAKDITSEMSANTIYVMANNSGTAEFQYLASALTIPAGKAYLPVAKGGVKALNIVIDGTATGIEAASVAEKAEEEGVLYNTAGQQVTADYRGIVIKNGKKFINK